MHLQQLDAKAGGGMISFSVDKIDHKKYILEFFPENAERMEVICYPDCNVTPPFRQCIRLNYLRTTYVFVK